MKKIFLFIFMFVFLLSCTKIPTEKVGIKRTFGKIDTEELGPGLHFYIPIVQNIQKVTVTVQNYEMRGDDAITALSKDGLEIKVDVSVLYRLKKDKVAELIALYGLNYERQILRPVVRTVVRDVISTFDSSDVYSKRNVVARAISDELRQKLPREYIVVEDVLVRNIKLPQKIVEAIEQKRRALEEAEKMKYVLEKERLEAERKAVEAEGIARANKIIANSLDEKYIQWYFLQSLKEYAQGTNNTVIVIPYDTKMTPILNIPRK